MKRKVSIALIASFLYIRKLIKFNPDIIALPLLFIVWYHGEFIIRYFHPQAALPSMEYIGMAIVAAMFMLVATFLIKLFFAYHIPWLHDYLIKKQSDGLTRINKDFNELASWQRILLFFISLFLLLYLFKSMLDIVR